MKQKAGKLSFIILAKTMTMGLMTGCSGKSSEKSESNDDKITLNAISFMGEDTKRNGFNKVIEAYEKANPGVEIKIQNLDYGTFTTTLQTRIGANDAPDLIFGTDIPRMYRYHNFRISICQSVSENLSIWKSTISTFFHKLY